MFGLRLGSLVNFLLFYNHGHETMEVAPCNAGGNGAPTPTGRKKSEGAIYKELEIWQEEYIYFATPQTKPNAFIMYDLNVFTMTSRCLNSVLFGPFVVFSLVFVNTGSFHKLLIADYLPNLRSSSLSEI